MSSAGDGPFRAAREAFEALIDLEKEAREARLAALAARDPALADQVRRLLTADAGAGEFLETPAGVAAREVVADWLAASDDAGRAGESVGPYRLARLLGRGGMGEVWEAERADGQFEQRLALKLLKRGMDSEEILRRFLRERQILARLAHPGIARLLEGGLTADGRPYFALEKVDGLPITEHAREGALTVRARVRLVIAAAEAVDSAHRQLVVHRDLKPSNILVTGAGEVKLLDFGIAKILGEGEDSTALTALGLRALTPAYAAPEQILGEPVTTATDVYSLGVVLFELLTGKLPHARSSTSAPVLMAELARETVPRLGAAVRQLDADELQRLGLPARELRRLERRVAGDLETILARALAREPERRYPSAAAFAEDLGRYLAGRPVRARPDARLYRLRKFVVRHRVGVAAALLALISLAGGLSVALWQARRAATSARQSAAASVRAERVKEFLISAFAIADPESGAGGTTTARQLIFEAGRTIDRSEFGGDPELTADLLEAVARIERNLGELGAAATHAARALALRRERFPAGATALAAATATLGSVRLAEGKLEEAEKELSTALAALAASEPPGSLTLARVRSDYADVLFWQGRTQESEALERKAWEAYRATLGDEALPTAMHLRNLGVLLQALGRADAAESALRTSQAVIEKLQGGDHPNAATSHLDLAVLLEERGKPEEAEALYRSSLAVRRASLGDHHLMTGQSLQLYALFLLNRGRLDESETLYREARALFAAINPRHFEVGKCDNGLALIAGRRGDHRTAERLLASARDLFREQLGERHPFSWQVTINLAREIAAQGRSVEALAIDREALAKLEEVSGPESAEVQWALERLADVLDQAGRRDEATAARARAGEVASRLAKR